MRNQTNDVRKMMEDMKSRDARRIWEAACKIVSMGQEPEQIRPFFAYVSHIKDDTRGVNMGGGILPNRRFVDFAIKTINFHKEGRGCPCQLYEECGCDCIFNPRKEEEKGYVRILDMVYAGDTRFVDYYVVQCTRCGQRYKVIEEFGHMCVWTWKKI